MDTPAIDDSPGALSLETGFGTLAVLPLEVVAIIFRTLTPNDLLPLGLCSRLMLSMTDGIAWRQVCQSDNPHETPGAASLSAWRQLWLKRRLRFSVNPSGIFGHTRCRLTPEWPRLEVKCVSMNGANSWAYIMWGTQFVCNVHWGPRSTLVRCSDRFVFLTPWDPLDPAPGQADEVVLQEEFVVQRLAAGDRLTLQANFQRREIACLVNGKLAFAASEGLPPYSYRRKFSVPSGADADLDAPVRFAVNGSATFAVVYDDGFGTGL